MMKRLVFFLIIILSFCNKGFSQDYSNYTHCAEQDSLALVAFYYATGGPDWISNVATDFSTAYLSDDVLDYYTNQYPNAGLGKWLEGPVKDWFGVTLEKQQIENTSDSAWRVIHLHPTLSRRSAGENNLNGYVPKEVGFLTALTWFKVNGNSGLQGSELPDELYHKTIEALDFESCYFSGILSSALRNCTKLGYPNFRYNNFDSVPIFDFTTENPWSAYYIYQNRVSWEILEPSIDFFINEGIEYEVRDQHDVGKASEIVVTPGSSITLTCTDAGINGTCTWYKKGINTYMTGTTYTINNISASDTGNYTVLIENEYIRLNDANADYANTFTKPIHVTFIPSKPVREKVYTSYDGNSVYIQFSKPMADPTMGQASQFSVIRNSTGIVPVSINRTGRLKNVLVLELGESMLKGDTIAVSYTKGSVAGVNGGLLESFTEVSATNYVRETPNLISAVTRKDGEGIVLGFDKYIDPQTLQPGDFTINATHDYIVEEVVVSDGEINENISKKITLILDESIYNTDVLDVSYTKGSLSALYGAAVQSFSSYPVENVVDSNRINLTIRVIDGSSSLDQVVIKGDMKSRPFSLLDDGTLGDETAGDNTWTKSLQLISGIYNWEVYNRKTIVTYDTVKTIDSETGVITWTLSPVASYSDSLISDSTLSITVDFENKLVTGDTVYNYRTNSVVFVLDMKNYLTKNQGVTIDPYLMGIKGDWLKGIQMTDRDSLKPDSTYIAVASGYNIKDVIHFSFRNGDVWENSTSKSRVDTVSKNDTVYAVFNPGVTTIKVNLAKKSLLVFPNPAATDNLTIYLPDNESLREVTIFDLYGREIIHISKPTQQIDISSIPTGYYIISATDYVGKVYRNQLIRK